MYISFGEHLKAARSKSGLTTQALAKACLVSRSYITLIENGHRMPGRKVLPKIAAALNVKIIVVLNWYLEEISQKMKKDLEV